MAFRGQSNQGNEGIYLLRRNDLEIVADRHTPVPGGQPSETFQAFDSFTLDDCDVVFVGHGSANTEGIYRKTEAGSLEVLVTHPSAAPENVLYKFGNPWTHNGWVVFHAREQGCEKGTYLFADGEIELIADQCGTPVPGGPPGATFTDLDGQPILEAGEVTFWGETHLRGQGPDLVGIYLADADGIRVVADTTTSVPEGSPGATFRDFYDYAPISNGEVVFVGVGSGDSIGIYRDSGGQIELLLDFVSSELPGWKPGELIDFGIDFELAPAPWYSRGLSTFGATGTLGSQGVFIQDESGIHSLLQVGDSLSGGEVTDLPEFVHLDGRKRRIALDVEVDGEQALYLARWER